MEEDRMNTFVGVNLWLEANNKALKGVQITSKYRCGIIRSFTIYSCIQHNHSYKIIT